MALISMLDKYGKRHVRTSDITFGVTAATNHGIAERQKWSMVFNMSESVLTRAGMKKGDRVNVLFDLMAGEGMIALNEDGWKLSGKGTSVSVSIMWREGLPSIEKTTACSVITVVRGRISFQLPDETEYEGMARVSTNA